ESQRIKWQTNESVEPDIANPRARARGRGHVVQAAILARGALLSESLLDRHELPRLSDNVPRDPPASGRRRGARLPSGGHRGVPEIANGGLHLRNRDAYFQLSGSGFFGLL